MDHTSTCDLRTFLTACETGDVSWVEQSLEKGIVKVDDQDEQGTTALQAVAAYGHNDLVTLLIMKGAALEKSNIYGWTPLLHAARHGHTCCVEILLQKHADINAQTRMGANALTHAIKGGHAKTGKLLLEQGIDLDHLSGPCELSPLFVACLLGMDSIVRCLIEKGFDIDQRMPSTNITPLMCTAINGHMTTAQILIEKRCDPNLTDVNEKTALLLAHDRGKREVTGFLDRKTSSHLPQPAEEDQLMNIVTATKIGDLGRVNDILDEDNTQKDFCSAQEGATPLMYAAMSGRFNVAQLLIERGCDINKQDQISSWTALMQAIFHGQKHIAKYLIANGADVTLQAKNGITAFDMATFIDDVDTDLLRLLAPKSNNKNKKDSTLKRSAEKSMQSDIAAENGGSKWWTKFANHFKNMTKTFSAKTKYSNNESKKMTKLNSSSTMNLHNTSSIDDYSLADVQRGNISSFMDKKKSASLYHLNSMTPHTTATLPLGLGGGGASTGDTLKPVLPPFLPQPSFDLAAETWKIPQTSQTKSGSILDLTVNNKHPMIRPSNRGRDGALSPTSDARFSFGSPSPNSSGGASSISNMFSGPLGGSSATSSTLTPGNCDRFSSRHHNLDAPLIRPPSFLLTSSRYSSLQRLYSPSFSPTNSTSSNSIKRNRLSKNRQNTSPNFHFNNHRNNKFNDSGTSTGHESLSSSSQEGQLPPINQLSQLGFKMLDEEPEPANDLDDILKNLSLEKYQPIFEKEEIDMEAFLMLTEDDLMTLGITHVDSRRQILSAISDISSGKNVSHRRSEVTDDMVATVRVRNSIHSDSTDLDEWCLSDPSNSR